MGAGAGWRGLFNRDLLLQVARIDEGHGHARRLMNTAAECAFLNLAARSSSSIRFIPTDRPACSCSVALRSTGTRASIPV